MLLFGVEDPKDSTNNLRGADEAGKIRMLLERLHKIFPRLGAVFPCSGIAARVNHSHDAVADDGHGSEVFPAAEVELHERSPVS